MIPITAQDIARLLAASRRVLLTTHVRSDGDAIGSELALALALRHLGVEVWAINDDAPPPNLSFLCAPDLPRVYDPANDDASIASADVIVLLDFNAAHRMGRLAGPVMASSATRLMIDHHLEPDPMAHWYYGNTEACSTGELVYDVVRVLLGEETLPRRVAEALYTAIMTDSGSFRYPRTSPRLHRIAATCLDAGADPVEIYRWIYEDFPPGRTHLLGRILADMEVLFDGRLSVLTCTQVLLRETGCTVDDVENMVSYGMAMRGVTATMLLTELDHAIKVSLRSRGSFSVQAVARHLGGGGHRNAAGVTVEGATCESVRSSLLAVMEEGGIAEERNLE